MVSQLQGTSHNIININSMKVILLRTKQFANEYNNNNIIYRLLEMMLVDAFRTLIENTFLLITDPSRISDKALFLHGSTL
jgi:hypothetical protein